MRRREFSTFFVGAATSTLWSSSVSAQKPPLVGFLAIGSAPVPGPSPGLTGLREGLGEIGYVDGQNVTIEFRRAQGRLDRLPALATDLVGRKVDVIVAGGDPAAHAAKNATSTIPIVFIAGDDAVRQGLVASLARPGGNLTGVSFLAAELHAKRFELLSELVPQAKVMALLVNPTIPNTERLIRAVGEAARPTGVQFQILKASTESEIDAAFATFVQQPVDAVLIFPDPFFDSRREQLVALAARYAVPALYEFPQFATAGGLISYGASLTAIYRQVGIYVGKILKGAKPADLPVVQPTTFELVINLKTAKMLGIAIPPALLARADEVIE
jgi:putative tryptophan/tyrosine transport system substrate-binding protein